MSLLTKIDSNVTGLRIAEEASIGVLDATPDWVPQEPNSYADFGGEVTTVARSPINPSRQEQKGVATDLDATAAFESDITQTNMRDPLQGFFFANLRRKANVGAGQSPRGAGLAGENQDYLLIDIDTTADEITVDSRVAVSAVTAVGGTGYAVGDIVEVADVNATVNVQLVVTGETGGVVDTVALFDGSGASAVYGVEGRTHTDTGVGAATTAITGSGDDGLTVTVTYGNGISWQAGDLLFLSGSNDAANDGLKTVSSVVDNVITTVENLVTDAAPVGKMSTVGIQAGTGDIDVDASGTLPALTSTTLDFTTLGIIPGEWICVGGDAAANQFVNAANNGFARVRSVAANTLTFDKAEMTMVTETGTGLNIQLFLGTVLKNETGTLIKRRTYQQERTLGAPDDAAPNDVQAEYIKGCVSNTFEFQVPTANKATAALGYVATGVDYYDAATPLKAGSRPALVASDAFNTSSDVSRIKMSLVSSTDEAPTALFAYVTDLTLSIDNGATPNKAVGVYGAFEVTVGNFVVSGDVTAYFADIASAQAVNNNSDVTLDAHLVKENAGISIDLPLLTLSDGRPTVEKDQPITLPLGLAAASGAKIDGNLDHTMLMVFWDYLPDAAE